MKQLRHPIRAVRKPSGTGGRVRLALLFTVTAAFLLVPAAQAFAKELHLTIGGSGEGQVVSGYASEPGHPSEILEGSPPIACSYDGIAQTGTCNNTFEFEESFELEAEALDVYAEEGSVFKGWVVSEGSEFGGPCEHSGAGNREGVCIFEGAPNVKVTAVLCAEAEPQCLAFPEPLSVFKGGNGEGTVTSNPTGISCGTEPCETNFEKGEAVELEASPGTGSVFAGWLGCRHTGATTCTVTMSEAKEVTAVFLAEGAPGAPGTNGKNIVATEITTAGLEGHCAGVGGVRVEVEGESSTRKYICNGAQGLQGNPGTPGTNGKNIVATEITTAGLEGHCAGVGGVRVEVEGESSTRKYICNGTNGTNGTNGSNGATGPQGNPGSNGSNGAQGPQGPAGTQGPAGPAAKVTCKVQPKGKSKVKVTCTVKQSASASSSALRWRLMRAGRAYGHGLIRHGRLDLGLDHARAGRYRLQIQGQKGGTWIVVG